MNTQIKKTILSGLMVFALLFVGAFYRPAMAVGEEDTFTIGMEVNYAPFNWSEPTDGHGAVPVSNSPGEYAQGYDVWMAKEIARRLGKKLVIVKIDWDGLPPALKSGKIDAILAGMSPTPERKEEIDFTAPYYQSDLVMVVRKDGPYTEAKSLEDFRGAKITGQLSTFHYTVVDQVPGVDKMPAMQDFPTMITALQAKKIDGYVSERPGARSAMVAHPDLTFVEFEEGKGFDVDVDDVSVAVGLAKGSPLREEVNRVMEEISQEDRDLAMDEAVLLSTEKEGGGGFFATVAYLWSNYSGPFLRGTGITLLIASLSTFFGFLIGLLVQTLRSLPTSRRDPWPYRILVGLVRALLTLYVEVFRGTPMMVQAMLIFYGSKMFFDIDMNAGFAAVFIVSINTGAYLSETIRGGIDSVPQGQWEAGKALGLSYSQTLFSVIFPQAIKAILPSIGNELIVNVKDTSVLNVISVTELFFITKGVAGATLKTFEAYLIAGTIYLFLTLVLSWVLRKIFARHNRSFILKSVTA